MLESPTKVRWTDCAGLVLAWGCLGSWFGARGLMQRCEDLGVERQQSVCFAARRCASRRPEPIWELQHTAGALERCGDGSVSMRLWGPAQRSWASSAGRLCMSLAAPGHAAMTARVPLAQVSCVAQAAQSIRWAVCPPGVPFLPQAGACFLRTHQYPFKVSLPPVVWAPPSALWRQRRIGLCFTYLLTPSLLCGFFSTVSNSCSAAFTFPKSSEMKLAYVNSFHCSFLDPETARRLSRLILTSVLAKPQAPTAELSIAQQGSWRSSTQRQGEDCLTSCCSWQAAALLQQQDF